MKPTLAGTIAMAQSVPETSENFRVLRELVAALKDLAAQSQEARA